MTSMCRASLWVSCLLVLSAASGAAQTAPAQQPSGPPPAHLSVIEGQAFVDREGGSDPAMANLPLLDGDRLRTVDGRIEVILPDGSLLHVDRDTTVDVLAADLLRLLHGRVYVIVRGARDPQRAVRYQIDAPVASVQTGGPGEFRVWSADTTRGREAELAVVRGQATLASNYGAVDVRAGERSVARDGLAPSTPQYFNSARWDAFDSWSAARRDERLGTVSVQYLPPDLTVYASTFDQYGTWRSDPEEGAVWYPTVAADWRPYSVGYWNTYRPWGWFWVGGDPWGWPTHHYGHWGFSVGFGWYWKPARVWGPAWVSWAYSPGYVSWCPLGRYGDPVFGHFGVQGRRYAGHVDPWRGWTVMPRQHFGRPTPVHRVAVDGNRLDPAARGAFAAGRPASELERATPRPGTGATASPRYAARGGASAPRGSIGAAPTPGGQARGSAEGLPSSGRARLSPDEAARILAGGGARTSGAPGRRTFPAAPAYTNSWQRSDARTDAPAAAPDATAFGNRRSLPSALPRENTRGGGPAAFGSGTTAPFGGARARSYPRASPAPESAGAGGWVPRASPRENPYIRGGGGSTGMVDRRAYPRSPAPPAEAAPRGMPSMRGNSGAAPGASARPRETGGGMSGGRAAPRGGPGVSSAPQASPRYNPGSGASQPRGGGAPPQPTRRRGGDPD